MASSDESGTYGCVTCGHRSNGLTAAWKHTEEQHPETITTVAATPEQEARKAAVHADLDVLRARFGQ